MRTAFLDFRWKPNNEFSNREVIWTRAVQAVTVNKIFTHELSVYEQTYLWMAVAAQTFGWSTVCQGGLNLPLPVSARRCVAKGLVFFRTDHRLPSMGV